jgi:hypothetical protein
MELDDLRRQWQRPEKAVPPAITPAELQALLRRQRGGLIEKMRRNTYWEAGVASVLVVPTLVVFLAHNRGPLAVLYAGSLALLTMMMAYYYYKVIRLLRRLAETTGSVRGHLERLYAGLRQLLRFYYRLTLATLPGSLLLIYGFFMGKELLRPGGFRASLLAEVGVGLLLIGALLQTAVVYGTRWWMQRLYGQHLDRLEGQLRELDEPASADS